MNISFYLFDLNFYLSCHMICFLSWFLLPLFTVYFYHTVMTTCLPPTSVSSTVWNTYLPEKLMPSTFFSSFLFLSDMKRGFQLIKLFYVWNLLHMVAVGSKTMGFMSATLCSICVYHQSQYNLPCEVLICHQNECHISLRLCFYFSVIWKVSLSE